MRTWAGSRSFRVGIDVEQPDRLITTGAFAFSRNSIYVALACVPLRQFLVFPIWITLAHLLGGIWLLHRQVLREEVFLRQHYGGEYEAYGLCDIRSLWAASLASTKPTSTDSFLRNPAGGGAPQPKVTTRGRGLSARRSDSVDRRAR